MAAHDARNKADPKDHLVSRGQLVRIKHVQDDDSLREESVRKRALTSGKFGSDIMVS
jgi:hypothetical protein